MSHSSTSGSAAGRIADRAAVLVLALVAVAAALTFRDYGLGWDDYTHSEYGELLVRLYASGFQDRGALSFVNLYEYGGGFDLLAALVAKALPFDLFETRRLVGAAVGIVGLAATWRLARRVGGPSAGLIALALLASCPLYVGHMFMNAKDAPFAVAMVILLLGLVRIFEDYPAPAPLSGLIFGIGTGLAIGTRILGGMAAIYALAAFVLVVVTETRRDGAAAARRAGRFVVALLPWLVLAYAVMALVWPWSVVNPLNPLRALEYFSVFFEKPWRELFAGELILVPDMPRQYLPRLLALKLPELMLALGIAGLLGAVVAAVRPSFSPRRRAVYSLLALAAAFPVALTVATRPAMYNGIRHFVFILPPLAVLGGLAGAWLIQRAQASRAVAAAVAAVIAAGCLQPVLAMMRLHPYEYTHFNLIAGGVAGARDRYMIDYWGLSFKQASQALLAHIRQTRAPPGRPWRVAVCGPHGPAQVALGPDFTVSWDPRDADFAMMLGEYYCLRLDAPVIAEIARDGAVYARVYDIAGKSITNLLTIPAP
jgi:hypothetical protein